MTMITSVLKLLNSDPKYKDFLEGNRRYIEIRFYNGIVLQVYSLLDGTPDFYFTHYNIRLQNAYFQVQSIIKQIRHKIYLDMQESQQERLYGTTCIKKRFPNHIT